MYVFILNSGYNVGEVKEYFSVNNYVFRLFCDMVVFYGRKVIMGILKLLIFSGLFNLLYFLMIEIVIMWMSGES